MTKRRAVINTNPKSEFYQREGVVTVEGTYPGNGQPWLGVDYPNERDTYVTDAEHCAAKEDS
jgi:hypothetical protein